MVETGAQTRCPCRSGQACVCLRDGDMMSRARAGGGAPTLKSSQPMYPILWVPSAFMSIPRAWSYNIDGTIVSTTMRSLVKTTASSFQPATDSELLSARVSRSAGQQVSRSAGQQIGRTEHDRFVTQRNVLCRGSRAIRRMRAVTVSHPVVHVQLPTPHFHLIHLKAHPVFRSQQQQTMSPSCLHSEPFGNHALRTHRLCCRCRCRCRC